MSSPPIRKQDPPGSVFPRQPGSRTRQVVSLLINQEAGPTGSVFPHQSESRTLRQSFPANQEAGSAGSISPHQSGSRTLRQCLSSPIRWQDPCSIVFPRQAGGTKSRPHLPRSPRRRPSAQNLSSRFSLRRALLSRSHRGWGQLLSKAPREDRATRAATAFEIRRQDHTLVCPRLSRLAEPQRITCRFLGPGGFGTSHPEPGEATGGSCTSLQQQRRGRGGKWQDDQGLLPPASPGDMPFLP